MLREFCDKAEQRLDPRTWQRSIFATCFCQNGDALGQWRAYAGPRGGYAVGLRSQALTYGSGRYPAVALRRVIYDPERQNALISGLLDRAMFALRSPDGQGEEGMEAVLDFLTDHMVELVASFKHVAFKEDEEWRLLVVADTAYAGEGLADLSFRQAGGHIVPFMAVDIAPHGGGRGVADRRSDLRAARARGALRPRHRAAAQEARRHRRSRAAFGAGVALNRLDCHARLNRRGAEEAQRKPD